jgi:hypothetical protein
MWRWLTVGMSALLVCACGGDERGAAPVSVTVPARPLAPAAPAVARQPPPNPPRSVPTRLVGGPVLLRIRGAVHAPRILYVVVFRLNRPHPRFPHDPSDRDGLVPLPDGAFEELGSYTVDDYAFAYPDSGIFDFDSPYGPPDTDNCFAGELTTDDRRDHAATLQRLDALPDGAPVRVVLRPLTYASDATSPRFARRYVRHARVRTTRTKPFTDAPYLDSPGNRGLYLRITSPGTLRALRRIGCANTLIF